MKYFNIYKINKKLQFNQNSTKDLKKSRYCVTMYLARELAYNKKGYI